MQLLSGGGEFNLLDGDARNCYQRDLFTMEDKMSYQEYLARMREAGISNTVHEYHHYLNLLFSYLSPTRSIELTTQYLMMFLPRFEHYYPDVIWPRGVIESLQKNEMPSQLLIDAMFNEVWDRNFDSLGGNDFVSAIENILFAFKNKIV